MTSFHKKNNVLFKNQYLWVSSKHVNSDAVANFVGKINNYLDKNILPSPIHRFSQGVRYGR